MRTFLLSAAALLALSGLAPALAQSKPDEATLTADFKAADLNTDGFVDQDEAARDLIRLFIVAYANGDEMIVVEEMEKPDPAQLAKADKDSDMKISLREAIDARLAAFRKADTNGDGKLSLDEVLATR